MTDDIIMTRSLNYHESLEDSQNAESSTNSTKKKKKWMTHNGGMPFYINHNFK